MKYYMFLFFISGLMACQLPEGVDHPDVRIARDKWGVPHIHGKTDADVVYGLAWAQCEDDFITLQEQLLATKGMLGEVKGKDGVVVDFAVKFMQLREEVEKRYDQEITVKHKELLESYVSSVNTFARLFPGKVLLKDAFPVTTKDLLVAYQLGLVDITGAGGDLRKILNGTIDKDFSNNETKGSNAIAISNNRTDNGKTFLAINSHQPLEGWYSWYEAHLYSDEGLNILGGTFPGGIMIFHGVNEHLGWAHTVNHADFSDVYRLRMHDIKKDYYYLDGKLLQLKKKNYWAWMKVAGPLKIPVRRTIYESVYGPTFKTDHGFFSWRFVASKSLRMSEQWFAMDKASNFQEFQKALTMQAIPSTNIVYADRENNIYFISNARIPQRDPKFDWRGILPGDTSATLWDERFFPLSELPQVKNPSSGFVFNTNNSPFNATSPDQDPVPGIRNDVMGFQDDSLYNNRSRKFLHLINQNEILSYKDFKEIKFNTSYPDTLASPYYTNLELLLSLDPASHPEIADAINLLNNWDRGTGIDSKVAPLYILCLDFLDNHVTEQGRKSRGGTITEEDCVTAIRGAKNKLLELYGQLEIPLGNIQRHIRGEINLPLSGGPDVLAAMYWQELENQQFKGVAGESYIVLAQMDSNGVTLETINAYGSSADPSSSHFTDQMEMYVSKQLKSMSLNINQAFEEADTIYHPHIIKK